MVFNKLVNMKKVFRIFWILYYRVLFKYKSIPFGGSMRICNRIYLNIKCNTNIKIGNEFGFSSGGGYNPLARNIKGALAMEENSTLIIGDNVGISSSCLRIYDYLVIKDRVKIGADCIIIDSDGHSLDFQERGNSKMDRLMAKKAGITINEDVLIGTRCIILKGVSIGARSIIGSGSVVSKNIPPGEIWAGNPIKFIKKLKN